MFEPEGGRIFTGLDAKIRASFALSCNAGTPVLETDSALSSALAVLPEIAANLKDRRPVLFLDYDGTLTPIVSDPGLATLDDEMRACLSRLVALCPVAIVSGRDLDDVRALVGLDDLLYAGSHGFDIAGPDGIRFQEPAGRACLAALDAAERDLSEKLTALPGSLVERKRFSLAAHFRGASPTAEAAVRAAVNAVAERQPSLKITGGKKVLELRPNADWDKGKAVAWLLETLGCRDARCWPIYIGDDLTDEDGFRAVASQGLGIIVGDVARPTLASRALADPDAVRIFLESIESLLKAR